MGGIYNLAIFQSATFTFSCQWLEAGCCAVGSTEVPVDLTGYTAELQIRPYVLSTTLLFDASSDVALGTTTGTINIIIPPTVTAGFTWASGVYDLLMTSPTGVATRLLSGTVTVSPGVSAYPTALNLQTSGGTNLTTDGGAQIWID